MSLSTFYSGVYPGPSGVGIIFALHSKIDASKLKFGQPLDQSQTSKRDLVEYCLGHLVFGDKQVPPRRKMGVEKGLPRAASVAKANLVVGD